MLMATEGKTTSFTPEQKVQVDEVITALLQRIELTLNCQSERITAMDKRPKQVWSETKPDVFFRYVCQGMLEDLIAELQARV